MERDRAFLTYTDFMVNLVAEISLKTSEIESAIHNKAKQKLREANLNRIIQSSLAIEHNTLSRSQVNAVIEGKKIIADPEDIREVKNAYEVYRNSLDLDPMSINDLLRAHRIMMEDLIPENGQFRSRDVGVFAGSILIYLAPSSSLVPEKMQDLFDWYQTSEMHPLIKSCVFHSEFESIHPFLDGNGRLGRLWQNLLLMQWKDIFYWLPVDDLVLERQQAYYEAIRKSEKEADNRFFVEFMLQAIADTMNDLIISDLQDEFVFGDLSYYENKLVKLLGSNELSCEVLMNLMGLKHKSSFRKNYLFPALQKGLIEMTIPDKPTSRNQKYRLASQYRMRSR